MARGVAQKEMNDEKRITVEDYDPMDDGFGFRCKWAVSDHWADVTVYEVVATGGKGEYDKKFFDRKPWNGSGDHVEDIALADEYLEGFVKWDGCTELNQGQPHWCGPHGYKKHIAILKYIYQRAHQLMGREPETPW